MPLPQQPARVKVTLADGTVGWLADPPEERSGAARRSGGGSSTTGATPACGRGRGCSNWSGRRGSRGGGSTRPWSGWTRGRPPPACGGPTSATGRVDRPRVRHPGPGPGRVGVVRARRSAVRVRRRSGSGSAAADHRGRL